MDDYEITRRLNSTGKGCFVLYYHIFSDDTLSIPEKYDALVLSVRERGKKYTKNAIRTRVSKATGIISMGAAPRALEIILSSKVGYDIKKKARDLLNKLGAAK